MHCNCQVTSQKICERTDGIRNLRVLQSNWCVELMETSVKHIWNIAEMPLLFNPIFGFNIGRQVSEFPNRITCSKLYPKKNKFMWNGLTLLAS